MNQIEASHRIAGHRLCMPERVVFTRSARDEPFGQSIHARVECLGLPVVVLPLAECIRHFGDREGSHLRRVTKFAAVDPLLDLLCRGRTRCRMNVNAVPIARTHDLGVTAVADRLAALRQPALPPDRGGGDPVGLVIAPIMPTEGWREHYAALLDEARAAMDFPCDLTFELITDRFTAASRAILLAVSRSWPCRSTSLARPMGGFDAGEFNRSVS